MYLLTETIAWLIICYFVFLGYYSVYEPVRMGESCIGVHGE